MASEDNQELADLWADFMLSVPCIIENVTASDTIYLRRRQLREDVRGRFSAVGLTLFQEVYDVISFKTRLDNKGGKTPGSGKVTAKDLADAYLESIKFAEREDEDKMSAYKVTSCIYVFNNLLVFPDVAKFLQERFDTRGQSFYLNGIEKLKAVVATAKNEADLAMWILNGVDTLQTRCGLHRGPCVPVVVGCQLGLACGMLLVVCAPVLHRGALTMLRCPKQLIASGPTASHYRHTRTSMHHLEVHPRGEAVGGRVHQERQEPGPRSVRNYALRQMLRRMGLGLVFESGLCRGRSSEVQGCVP
jgi:hypothetical protein